MNRRRQNAGAFLGVSPRLPRLPVRVKEATAEADFGNFAPILAYADQSQEVSAFRFSTEYHASSSCTSSATFCG